MQLGQNFIMDKKYSIHNRVQFQNFLQKFQWISDEFNIVGVKY